MDLPVAILIVFGAAAAAFAAVALVRRALGSVLSNPVRGTPMAIVGGTSFAVLLAFLILAAFGTYGAAKTGAASEANAVLDMFRTAALFPASQRDQLRSDFTCYGRAVVGHEWPAMRHEQSSPLVDYWIARYRAEFVESCCGCRYQMRFAPLNRLPHPRPPPAAAGLAAAKTRSRRPEARRALPAWPASAASSGARIRPTQGSRQSF